MSNEEKFKDSVKNLLDEQYFAYDPSNWEVASKKLDKDDKKKKRFLYIIFFGLGLGLLITGRVLFSTETDKNAITQVEKESEALALKVEKNEILSQKTNKHQKNSISSREKEKVSETKIPRETSEPIGQPSDQEIKETTNSVLSEQKSFVVLKKKLTKTAVSSASISLASSMHVAITKTKKKIQAENENEEETVIPVKPDDTKKLNNDRTLLDNNKENDSPPSLLPAFSVYTVEQKQEEGGPVSAINFTSEANNSGNKNAKLALSLKDTIIKTSREVKLPDSTLLAVVQPTLQNEAKTNSYCYVEAGAYFNLGWKYQGTKEGAGINPYLGMSYLTMVSDKLSFSIGAYYSTLSHLKLDTRTIKSSKIVFGEESDVTSITPITVNFILIPLKIGYSIDSNQSITMGTTIGYLLDVQSKVETYSERLGTQQNNKNYKTGGYVEGFKTFNTQLSLGYRRRISKNLWMNADILYGLTDVRDNAFFGINLKEQMTGLKVGLTYDLLKK